MKSLLTFSLVLFVAPMVGAQPFAECGLLVGDASGFPDCVHLMPDSGGGPLQMNGNLAGFQVGDYVYVEGTQFSICATFCWDPVGCIDFTLIQDCAAMTFADCGTLVDGGGCTLLQTEGGETYDVSNLGGFEIGNIVFVEGDLDTACVPSCSSTDGCITNNTIEICPTIEFIRGDCDNDGGYNGLLDGLRALNFQFIPGTDVPACMEACDVDDSGDFNGLLDGLFALNCQFVMGSPCPTMPYPDCGVDPDSATSLTCDQPNPVCNP